MSDTPRTDKALGYIPCHPDSGTVVELVDAEFARQLERELASAMEYGHKHRLEAALLAKRTGGGEAEPTVAGTRIAMRNRDCQAEVKADDATKEAVFAKLVTFLNEHRCWSGETYYQSDGPQIGSQELMGEFLDLLDAKVVWE